MIRAKKIGSATYEDLCNLPPEKVGEILSGELIASPRPAGRHALATSNLSIDLGPFARKPGGPGGPGGWILLYEPELHFGDDVLVPDLAGWRRERMPTVRDELFFTLAPDWVCEVLSPSTRRIDRVRKMPVYAAAQVPHLWLVDPLDKLLEVYRLEGARWSLVGSHSESDRVRAPPFEEVELQLDRLWGDEA